HSARPLHDALPISGLPAARRWSQASASCSAASSRRASRARRAASSCRRLLAMQYCSACRAPALEEREVMLRSGGFGVVVDVHVMQELPYSRVAALQDLA